MFGRVRGWIRRFLRIEEIESKMQIVEASKADLEKRIISTEKTKEMIRECGEQANLGEAMIAHLEELGIELPESSQSAAMRIMDAAAAVETYEFRRHTPAVKRAYAKPVISMKEFREHPEQYIHKLSKGFFNFPLGLNFKQVNRIMRCTSGRIDIGNSIGFVLEDLMAPSMIRQKDEHYEARIVLKKATEMTDLDIYASEDMMQEYIRMDALDFLSNYEGITRFVAERHDLDDESKSNAIKAFELSRYALLTAIETVGRARIKDPSELLNYKEEQTTMITNPKEELLKIKIRQALLTKMKGTTYYEVQNMLPIRSREEFRELASQRTLEILARDRERKGLTQQIGKELKDYTIGESVVMACYFARNIIKKYSKLEDCVKALFRGENDDEITGKCTDYTAIALHYLREYLIPLNPKKFNNWHFGHESEKIGNYRHAFMKIMHVNPDRTVDVYFVDPTALANKGIKALKTPKDVLKYGSADNLPIQIQRDAEDLLRKPIE